MNAQSPDEFATASRPAVSRANEWRGRMINLYAVGEMLIATRLRELENGSIAMANAHRMRKLKSHYEDQPKVLSAIDDYELCRLRRHAVVHGHATISECPKGWVLNLEHDDGKARLRDFILESESQQLCKDLLAIVNRLRSRLKA